MEPLGMTQVSMLPPQEFYEAHIEFLDSIEALLERQREFQVEKLSPEDVVKLMEENKMLEDKVLRLESEVGKTFEKLLALRRIRDEKEKEVARNKDACQQLEMLVKQQETHTTLPNTTIPVSDLGASTDPSSVTQETNTGENIPSTTAETVSVQKSTNQCDKTVNK